MNTKVGRASIRSIVSLLLGMALMATPASSQTPKTAVRISLDEAVQMSIQHNHVLIAARNTIQQAQAEEITANLRPNPTLTVDWEYLPFFTPSSFTSDYLHDSTEADVGAPKEKVDAHCAQRHAVGHAVEPARDRFLFPDGAGLVMAWFGSILPHC